MTDQINPTYATPDASQGASAPHLLSRKQAADLDSFLLHRRKNF
jgi:hypothetical protein